MMRFFLFVQLSTMFEPDAQERGLVLAYDYDGLDFLFVLQMQVCALGVGRGWPASWARRLLVCKHECVPESLLS